MSTVQSLYSLVQYRNGITVSLDDLIHIVNNAVRTIAKRLYWLESDLLREEMSVSVWAQVTHTGTDIVFNNANPDTITSATGGFLTSRLAADMPITTDSTVNGGPFRIVTAADKTLTLASTDSVTAATAGTLQMAATTINLQQAASTYTLFTGATQPVMVEALTFALPNVNVSDDATITYITIQTDHTTPQVIFNSTTGAKANLTAENQLAWDGPPIYLPVGKKIQLTIAGGAADASTVCNVTAEYRAVAAGGTLN